MANKAKSITRNKQKELMIVNPNSAGIDVASTEYQVCVPEGRNTEANKTFGCFTRDLHEIAKWLKACNIETVAMEATGIYWVQLFLILQQYGFDVVLANAQQVKNIAGKKTDIIDASWIQLLHSYGLVKSSFQTDNISKQLRSLMRQRGNLIRSASKEVQHIQKALELMNIKVHKVISDILGKSGISIVEAIIEGERDAKKLSEYADRRIKASKEDIIKSLEGIWLDDQLFILKKSYQLFLYYHQQIKEYDEQIERITKKYSSSKESSIKQGSKKKRGQKNDLHFDAQDYLNKLFGVNLTNIPGISNLSAMKLLSELGIDFTEKFDNNANKFASWSNVVPNNKKTGGKIKASYVPKRKNNVGQIFRQSATTLSRSKNPIGDFFRRIKSKRGYNQAVVATANKLARIFFTMVSECKEYDEKMLEKNKHLNLENQIAYARKRLINLEKKILLNADDQSVSVLVI
jgi:transposase